MPAQTPNDRRPRAVAIFLALTALLLAGATARLGMAEDGAQAREGCGRPGRLRLHGRSPAVPPPGYLYDPGR